MQTDFYAIHKKVSTVLPHSGSRSIIRSPVQALLLQTAPFEMVRRPLLFWKDTATAFMQSIGLADV